MRKILPDSWPLPDSIRARVGTSAGRQRLVMEEGHAVLLLHQPPAADEHERRPAIFWRSPDGAWRSTVGRDGMVALRGHLESYATRVTELDAQLDAAKGAEATADVMRAARPLQRAAGHMHSALQALREAVPADEQIVVARDRAYDVARTAELVVEDASAAMQLVLAKRAEEQAALSTRIAVETHRLNLLAAVCLPITALGAVLGMNLPSGLDALAGPATYWSVVAAAFGLGLALNLWVRRPHASAPRTA
jgi:hypothetical protein